MNNNRAGNSTGGVGAGNATGGTGALIATAAGAGDATGGVGAGDGTEGTGAPIVTVDEAATDANEAEFVAPNRTVPGRMMAGGRGAPGCR